MSLIAELFWATLIVGGLTLIAVAGALLVRRWVPVDVLERHNEVAGFIYSVIGVMYAVLLGFTAIIVWERYDQAQAEVEKEANVLGDLFRDAQAFPDDTRRELETNLRTYAKLVVDKEWPRWPNTTQARKLGTRITRFGKHTTGSRPRTSRRGYGTPSHSQG